MKIANKFFSMVISAVFFCGALLLPEKNAFAKCEMAAERLRAAEAELNAANNACIAAAQAAKQAAADLDKATADLNAVAGNLGAQGRATSDSAQFGRSPTNPSFFDDPGYKAAKQAWQDAKDRNAAALNNLKNAQMRLGAAQNEYNNAKAEYDRLRRLHLLTERAGDSGLLLPPEPVKTDEKLGEKVKEIIKYKYKTPAKKTLPTTGKYEYEKNKTKISDEHCPSK